ncbi:alpha/beta hydrolase [Actinophytocola xinjiangensis]|uniref:Alpha/beta hydrolase n=1 Tax=Actinophytocola xinjiangensis TaxID=485602 RepID=A0A7Z0WNN5_9PSEU|nr:alpha/beta hydrolase [Actinophytocola xinjiangensis]OLF11697.1 alpha/beta hydrolase [Actinophytocola xinjiangensis]
MPSVTSTDGTSIAYELAGDGPVIVFVPGAFNDRRTCAPLAEALRDDYTVVSVDRRGRGGSTDAIAPADAGSYTVAHEIDDLDAVLAEVGPAAVFGFSSGANLALMAAAAGSAITRLVMYEAPFALGDPARAGRDGLVDRLAALVADGRAGDAVATMQTEGIGLPAEMVDGLRRSPLWAGLEAIAQTVVYDAVITRAPNVPTAAMASVAVPTLVLAGARTWPGLRDAARALPGVLADARYVELPGGEDHAFPVAATAEAVAEFLASQKPA